MQGKQFVQPMIPDGTNRRSGADGIRCDTDGNVCKSHDEREQDNFEDFWVTPAQGALAAEHTEDLLVGRPGQRLGATVGDR